MKRVLACLCVAMLAAFFAAGAAFADTVTGINLPTGVTVDVGSTYKMVAALLPDGVSADVVWYSSRPQYATVDAATGLVTGVRMGKTMIIAKAGGKIAGTVITVTVPSATSIRLNRTAKTLNPTDTCQLVATLSPLYTSEKPVWTSGDDTVATVSDTGLVTPVSDGTETRTCVITASLKNGRSATCAITVVKIPEKYVRMPTSAVVPLYATRQLVALVYPLDAFDRSLTWSVVYDPNSVLELVDAKTGVFKGVKRGAAIIEARTANGCTARCTVTVKLVRYSSFSVSPASKVLMKGDSFVITTKRSPAYVSYPDITCDLLSDDDKEVVKVELVDGQWVVTGLSRGYARVYVTADNGRVVRAVTVRVLSNDQVTVKVSAIGDVMLGGDPRKGKGSYDRFLALWTKYGAGYFFARIKGEFEGVTIANLEIPLINTSSVAQSSRSYVFRGRTEYAEALRVGGINVAMLDNNHIMDYGSSGLKSTRSALLSRGIKHCGVGSVAYVIKNGIKIGFVGYRPENISISRLKSNIQSVQKQCDIVVASFHWGVEYRYAPTAQQIAYGHAAVAAGADLVVGHHSHVVSGIEVYRSKYIVYGLGTIVSTVTRPSDIDAFIYRHTFGVTGTAVSNVDRDIIPVLMTAETSYNDAQPVLATGDARSSILSKINRYSPTSY